MNLYEDQLQKYDAGLIGEEPSLPKIDLSDAIQMCQKLLEKYPNVPFKDKVLYRIAICYLEEDQKDKAKEYFQKLINESRDSEYLEEAYFRLGEYYFDLRYFEKAIDYYSYLLKKWDSPYFNMALYKLGWSYYNLERYTEAISTLIYLIEDINLVENADKEFLGKTNADLRSEAIEYVAICFAEYGGPEKARQFFRERKDKEYTKEILFKLADIYQRRNFYVKAIETLKILLDFYPYDVNVAEIQKKIVENYELAGDRESADRIRAQLVTSYGPGSPWLTKVQNPEIKNEVLETLEEFLYTLGTDALAKAQETKSQLQYQLAINRYRDFLQKFPNSKNRSKILFYLAEALYEVEKYEEAADTYYELITNYPDSEFRETAAYHRILAYDQLLQKGQSSEPSQFILNNFLGLTSTSADTIQVPNGLQAKFLQACNDFVSLFPNSDKVPEVIMKFAETLYKIERYDLAQQAYLAVINRGGADGHLPQAYTMVAQSAFKLGNYEEAEKWFKKLSDTFPDSSRYVVKAQKMIASSKFKVAEHFIESGEHLKAAREFEKIAGLSPDPAIAERALFEAALQYEKVGEKEQAIGIYEKLAKRFPQSKLIDEALFKAGVLAEELNDWLRAATNYVNLYHHNPSSKFAPKSVYSAAKCYDNLGNYENAIFYYNEYLTKFPEEEPDRLIEAAFRKGEIAYNQGNFRKAQRDLAEVVKIYENLVKQGKEVDAYFPANAQFLIGEILFKSFQKIKLVPPFQRNLKRKKRLFQSVIKAYTEAAKFKIAEWATAASFRIGQTFEEFAKAFMESPIPKNLSPADVEKYKAQLYVKVLPFKEKAFEAYKANIKKALENQIQNVWVDKTRERLETLRVELGISLSELNRELGS
ncbi:MAG: outer membrane protein assembly factor BamD [Calditrichaeota bacterium]|nr:MAG: outer membrane protein assembly factor BamD [Calditrichota bacterium]